jgi:hypothetical protein
VPGLRLSQVLKSFKPIVPQSSSAKARNSADLLENLLHFSTPTLAQLIALLTHPIQSFPLQNTSLIIIDSFSTLISNAFPRTVDVNATPRKPGGKLSPSILL